MENEVMITVLNEVLSEQKETNQKMIELSENVSLLTVLNSKLANKFEYFQRDISPDNLRTTALINRSAKEIKRLIEEQPKEIKQEKRYLFFPENNVTEYYCIFLTMLTTYSYQADHHSDDVDHFLFF